MSGPFQELQHSVYVGRDRLGRYVQTAERRVEAFDADDRRLGVFTSRANALAVIGSAGIALGKDGA